MTIPRPEYPRPQLVRDSWLNLNGTWDFAFDFGSSGRERELEWTHKILVPFCPESSLSGIGYKDFLNSIWYRRTFQVPEDWHGKRILLHFGAVDYQAQVWLNGNSLGTHRGGYASFSFEITKFLAEGENTIILCAEDDNRLELQPRGKQSAAYHSHGCDYTRITGIWQTVWLEAVPQTYLSELKLVGDLENGSLSIEGQLEGRGATVTAKALFAGEQVGTGNINTTKPYFKMSLDLAQLHPWSPQAPNLYDLELEIQGEDGSVDHVQSYFGLRDISWHDGMRINGKKVFMRLVLDQGYYPDGIYTAPSDATLRDDIQRALDLGFNGARLHQKVFEPRFLYWADKLGYLLWGEHGSWGLSLDKPEALGIFLPEWVEIIKRDWNHPAIIGWCPLNETRPGPHRGHHEDFVKTVWKLTKQLDPTRPVIDTSGYTHEATDLYDVHDYDQDPASFYQRYQELLAGKVFVNYPQQEQYRGEPYWVSEYGGIWWQPQATTEKNWGYGQRPSTEEEFLERYRALTQVLLDNPKICGFCYTQLYDVEQEVNGLYTYERKAKFAPSVIREINTKSAAYEKD